MLQSNPAAANGLVYYRSRAPWRSAFNYRGRIAAVVVILAIALSGVLIGVMHERAGAGPLADTHQSPFSYIQ